MFGQAVGGVRSYYSFELFLEIRNEDQKFRSYNKGGREGKRREGLRYTCMCTVSHTTTSTTCTHPHTPGISLKIRVIDVSTKTAREPVVMRAETGWTVGKLKKEIAEVSFENRWRRGRGTWGEGGGGIGGEVCVLRRYVRVHVLLKTKYVFLIPLW